jgi:hypothetical protein
MRRAAFVVFLSTWCAACAQTPEKVEPWFTLTISENRHDNPGPGIHRVNVTVTNTSKEAHHWEACATPMGYYSASVTYNGVPLVEQEQAKEKHQNQAKMRLIGCTKGFAGDKEATTSFAATMYAMWTPSGVSNPLPVPLGYVTWGYSGDAIQNLSTGVWSINPKTTSQGTAGSFVPSSTYPTWTTTIVNAPNPCS